MIDGSRDIVLSNHRRRDDSYSTTYWPVARWLKLAQVLKSLINSSAAHTRMRSLVSFILSANALSLYRSFAKALRFLPASDRAEYMRQLRSEFEKHRAEQNEEKVKYLIADGRKQLSQVHTMIGMLL